MTAEFQQYRRSQVAELRPYIPGEHLSDVSISREDRLAGSPKEGDMIARNPKNHADQWLVAAAYFKDNFEPMEGTSPAPEPRKLNTSDIGFAIRDFLGERYIDALDLNSDELTGNQRFIHFADISDPSNPILHTEDGNFRVSITRID